MVSFCTHKECNQTRFISESSANSEWNREYMTDDTVDDYSLMTKRQQILIILS